ncbi:MAG TPA: hypothetical protein VIL42_10685 [Sphingomicrobium sp.]|jgi:hypothetical protein
MDKLKGSPEPYLRKLRKPKRRSDQSRELAKMFDRMIERQRG